MLIIRKVKKIKENTICTISTKKGEGAIAIIRISGTEPLIRILVEGKNFQDVESYAKLIERKIRLNLAK